MPRSVNPRTLFHLVPTNQAARGAVLHPDNTRFVSPSAAVNEPGLEIGFHVPSIPSGRVITRLGRDADLILRERPISAVHIAFEIHPETLVVLLSVRSKNSSSVRAASLGHRKQIIDGDCVMVYGQDYTVTIGPYEFRLKWQKGKSKEEIQLLREFTIKEYRYSLRILQDVRSRDRPTEFDESELHTWHNTRLHTAKNPLFLEAEGVPRVLIGQGNFGKVYRAVDLASGHPFAVKVVMLDKYPNIERARAALHREVKTLERLKHKNIVECLCAAKWDTLSPEIFMPLRTVLEQMLCALDNLSYHGMCHRDVKPENILYWRTGQGKYHFQLADFGLANHQQFAITVCGTGFYKAPELFPEYGKFPQSPKMDVWSLFATIIDVHPMYAFPPLHARTYHDILQAVRAAVALISPLAHMARENPILRASAAQLLVAHFDGQGLTTPRGSVPPIEANFDDRQSATPGGSAPQVRAPPGYSDPRGGRPSEAVASSSKAPEGPPLIVYPVRRNRRPRRPEDGGGNLQLPNLRDRVQKPLPSSSSGQPNRVIRGGIVKPGAASNKPIGKSLFEGQPNNAFYSPGGFPT